MANARLNTILRHIKNVAGPHDARHQSDGDLLRSFLARHDPTAFEQLVRRHGSMVMALCRRVLGNVHDAEDVFQATFLVLARRASSVRKSESLASWLHGAAYRMAMNAKRTAARRRKHEGRANTSEPATPEWAAAWREVQSIFDEEILHLPEVCREPFVLCCLEHLDCREVAERLGLKEGTIWNRLSRARKLLRERLAKRGVVLGAVLGVAAITDAARAVVPSTLTVSLAKAAAGLAAGRALAQQGVSANVVSLVEEANRANSFAGFKALLAVAFLGAVMGGLVFALPARKDEPPQAAKGPLPPGEKPQRDGEPLPAGVVSRLGSDGFRHTVAVSAVAASPDGKVLASGSHLGTIRLWDGATGKQLHLLSGHRGGIYSLVFGPDGKSLASGSWDKSLIFWDVATGKQLWKAQGHADWVWCVAVAPDGKSVVSAGFDKTVRLWDAATGRELRLLQGHGERVKSVAFSPDGKLLASAGEDRTVRLWDLATGKESGKPLAHPASVDSVAFSPDGKLLAAGGGWDDSTVHLWDVADGKELRKCKGHEKGSIVSVVFSADGKTVVSAGGDDGTVRRFDVATGEERGQAGRQRRVLSLARAGDDVVITGGWDNVLRFWDVTTGKELRRSGGHQDWVWSASFSPDGRVLATAGGDRVVRLWDRLKGTELRVLEGHEDTVRSVAFSPDGKLLATGSNDKTIRLWDATTGKEVRRMNGENRIKSVAFSADGSQLASAAGEDYFVDEKAEKPGEARVWEVETGKELQRLKGFGAGVKSVAFSPDGKWLATGSNDATLRVWVVATGQPVKVIAGNPGSVEAVAFSPDGKLLASAGWGGLVDLWSTDRWEKVRELKGAESVISLAFSADGKTIAAGSSEPPDGTRYPVRVWEVATGLERARFAGQQNKSYGVALSPDGRVVASCSPDTTVVLFDLTGRLRRGEVTEQELTAEELDAVRQDLVGNDGSKVREAIWALAATPKQTVPWLRDRLKPPAALDVKQVAELIKNLDDDAFMIREKAMQVLADCGEAVEADLRKTLADSPSLEVRRRVEELLSRLDDKTPTGASLLRQRGLEVLEAIDAPQARELLESWAKATPETRLTKQAREAVRRSDRRAPSQP